MRLAQISDLHFGSFSLSPLQFFSKRWLGNFNFLIHRKKEFLYNRLIDLIDFFKEEKVTHILITGDLSVTSRRKEFKMGRRFVQLLEKEGFTVFTVPGNHDHYTKSSYRKKTFYRFFPRRFDKHCPFDLQKDQITYTQIAPKLWLVAIDTALATSWISSQGFFTKEIQDKLTQALQSIPKHDTIVLMNHFPLFENEKAKKQMMRSSFFQQLLKQHPNIKLYLNGHSHRQVVADLRGSDLPIISDCGSTPHVKNGACHLFDFEDNALKLSVYQFDGEWKEAKTHSFIL